MQVNVFWHINTYIPHLAGAGQLKQGVLANANFLVTLSVSSIKTDVMSELLVSSERAVSGTRDKPETI